MANDKVKTILRWGLTILVVGAAMTPVVGAVLDRGLDGRPRLTVFHIALTLSDDSTRHAIRNSLMLAATVAVLASGIGVVLGRIVSAGRFFGRDALAALVRAPAAYTPLLAAVGFLGVESAIPAAWREIWRWFALGWIELAWGVPRVMAAVIASFSKIERTWLDTARMAGAKQGRASWAIGWPLARSRVALAASEVFFLTLFEPGAPLILGIRNTLSVRLIESAMDLGQGSRAAVLATIGLILGLLVRGILVGSSRPNRTLLTIQPISSLPRPTRLATLLSLVTLGFWTVFALTPMLRAFRLAFDFNRSGRVHFENTVPILAGGEFLSSLGHSLTLGLAATMLAAIFGWALGVHRERTSWRDSTSWLNIFPPLVLILGVVLLPGLLDACSVQLGGPVGSCLRWAGDWLDPFQSPWFVLVLATAILHVPTMQAAFRQARSVDNRDEWDVARTLGASRSNAWLTAAAPATLAVIGSAIAVTISASALVTAPSLLLARTMAARPIVPVILAAASEPLQRKRAACLALISLLFPIASWAVRSTRNNRFFRRRLART
jgi:ABC-type Fe3+ transport system permease subunit